jgi:hypothetical protein
MRFWLLLLMLLAPFVAFAQTPDEDEKRVEELVRARYGPTPQEIDALALQGLGPDGQPLIDPSTGLPVVPGNQITPAPAPVVAAPEPVPEAAPPVDLPAVGPIVFEDLQKLVGYRVKVRTYNGVSWQGDVKTVKGNEVQINVQQRGGAALMTLKKTAIAKLERI